ncbi:MAG TPA: GntR family transcriptional regulator [Rubrobacteraceae bacterium]|nr:GntR family transcriptional regulator [Rubrobacteraceae bacterium]
MPLQRSAPLYQQVYELLRRKILEGEYAPGEGLHESRTAEMLRVSRTPVREALRQLEQDGLLVAHGPERVVRNLRREEFVELYTCRMALERLVADRAAGLATEEEIQEMASAVKEARAAVAAGDHAGVLSANTRFHDRMVESARMRPLRQLMGTIRGPILVARRRLLTDPEVEAAICDEHEKILDAIRRKDIRVAQERMEWHMKNDIERGIASFDR